MSEIRWEGPSTDPRTLPKTPPPRAHVELAEALRARPGEWAIFSEDGAPANATHIKQGKRAAFRPAGSFDAVTRSHPGSRRCVIYVRYIGEEHGR